MKTSIWWKENFAGTLDLPVPEGETEPSIGRPYPGNETSFFCRFMLGNRERFDGDDMEQALLEQDFIDYLLEHYPGASRLPDDPDADYDHSWWCGRAPEQFYEEYQARRVDNG